MTLLRITVARIPQVLLTVAACTMASHDVMVVTSTEESAAGEPRVLEIFDFQTHKWRAVEKSESSVTPSEFYRVAIQRTLMSIYLKKR